MRTIEFRGRHLCGQWYYGNLIVRETDSPVPETAQAYKCVMIGDVEDGSAEEVEEETVGQFTGLLDKNGKEIYEGDIIHLKGDNYDKDFGIVKWHTDGYFYIDDNFGKFPKDKTNPIGNFFDFIRRDFKGIEASVNGNIHDNPEILKGE